MNQNYKVEFKPKKDTTLLMEEKKETFKIFKAAKFEGLLTAESNLE
jgi:hypothetical protein